MMKNEQLKPQYPQLRETSREVARQFSVNWSRFERHEWQDQFSKLVLATFLNTHPDTVLKACSHVLLTNSDEYPPSQGKLLQQMREYIGTGAARSPKLKSCNMCTDGLRKIAFWIRENGKPKYIETNAACRECERGAKRKSSLKMLDNLEFIMRLLKNEIFFYTDEDGEQQTKMISGDVQIRKRYRGEWTVQTISRDYWLQTMTDEQPPVEMLCRDLNEVETVSDFGQLAKERREAKERYMEALKAQERHLLQKEESEIVQTFDALKNDSEMELSEYTKVKEKISNLKESIVWRQDFLRFEDITLDEYLVIKRAREKQIK